MKNKLFIFFILIFSFSIYGLIYGNEKIEVNKIEFYGTFISQEYINEKGNFVGVGGEVIKLPALINYWPADNVFDFPPEIIIIMGEFINNSKENMKSKNVNISVKFRISKIIYDKNGEMDVEKSEKNQYWDKIIYTNSINLENLEGSSKVKKELLKFNIWNLLEEYEAKGLNPWLCEVEITDNKGLKITKTFEIGVFW